MARSPPRGSAHISSMRPTTSPSRPRTQRPRRSSIWISLTAMSRAWDLADDVVAQPVLPVEYRRLLHVEIEPSATQRGRLAMRPAQEEQLRRAPRCLYSFKVEQGSLCSPITALSSFHR